MGFFDRWRKKSVAEAPPPEGIEPRAEGTEPRAESIEPRAESIEPRAEGGEPRAENADATMTVPEGHRVDIFEAVITPRVVRTPGGVVIVHLGLGCDEPAEVLEELLGEVEAALESAPSRVLLVAQKGPLGALFAPANPALTPMAGVVLWVLYPGSLAGWVEDPSRLQALLRRIHRIGASRGGAVLQGVYWCAKADPGPRLELELLGGLGLEVRRPEQDASLLAEVHRPEGVILSALLGRHHAFEGAPDPYPRVVNEEKDRAEGDPRRLEHAEQLERAFLAKRIVETDEGRKAELPTWAPRLCRLLLEVATTNADAANEALQRELAGRNLPLLLMGDPRDRSVSSRKWPGHGPALAAYPDAISFGWAVQDMKLPPESLAAISMEPRSLFDYAAGLGVAVAINVYRDRTSPLYVMLPAEKVKSLASSKGKR